MIRNILFLIVCGTSVMLGHAQPPDSKKGGAAGEVELTFANGSVVRMDLLPVDIEIITPYGALLVPAREIRRIDFGLHLAEATQKKIGAAIQKLGSADIMERDAAGRDLVALGAPAYPFLLQAARDGDKETSKRAKDALAQIKAKTPAQDLRTSDLDKVVTRRFTIVGRITTPSIKAKSEYFKDVEHALAKLRYLRALGAGGDTEVVVDAAQYALNTRPWLDTGIHLDGAGTLLITASGEVELRPSLPGNFVCGPKGLIRFKGKKGGGGMAQSLPGTLLGRIGEKGEPFVIGDRFEAPLERDGKLYLQINPSPYENASTGSYQVKVQLRD